MSEPDGFLSRWARRKAQVRAGIAPTEVQTPVGSTPAPGHVSIPAGDVVPVPTSLDNRAPVARNAPGTQDVRQAQGEALPSKPPAPPPPTMDDVALLTRDSSYARFVAPGVDSGVRNAAMKKLFTDPHFNVMDGLDTYIDDYGKPDPIPESMLRLMRQSKFLGFLDEQTTTPQTDAEGGSGTGPPNAIEPGPEAGPGAPAGASTDVATDAVTVPHDGNPSDGSSGPAPALGSPPLEAGSSSVAARPDSETTLHEDTDLRLQQDDAAGRPGPDQGARA